MAKVKTLRVKVKQADGTYVEEKVYPRTATSGIVDDDYGTLAKRVSALVDADSEAKESKRQSTFTTNEENRQSTFDTAEAARKAQYEQDAAIVQQYNTRLTTAESNIATNTEAIATKVTNAATSENHTKVSDSVVDIKATDELEINCRSVLITNSDSSSYIEMIDSDPVNIQNASGATINGKQIALQEDLTDLAQEVDDLTIDVHGSSVDYTTDSNNFVTHNFRIKKGEVYVLTPNSTNAGACTGIRVKLDDTTVYEFGVTVTKEPYTFTAEGDGNIVSLYMTKGADMTLSTKDSIDNDINDISEKVDELISEYDVTKEEVSNIPNRLVDVATQIFEPEVEAGYGIDYTTGELVEYGGTSTTVEISCKGFKKFYIKRSENLGLVFYDKDGNKIKPLNSSNYTDPTTEGVIEIPDGAVLFRASSFGNRIIQLRLGYDESNKGNYVESINGFKLQNTTDENYSGLRNHNLYIPYKDTTYLWVNPETGAVETNYICQVSDYIALSPNSFYELSGRIDTPTGAGIVGYDADKNIVNRAVIDGSSTYYSALNGTISSKEDISYIRFTTQVNSVNDKSKIVLKEIQGNIFDKTEVVDGGVDYNSGSLIGTGEQFKSSPKLNVESNCRYLLSGRINTTSIGIVGYDENNNVIKRNIITGFTGSSLFGDAINGYIETGDDVAYIQFTAYSSYDTRYTEEEQLASISLIKCSFGGDFVIRSNYKNVISNYYVNKKGQVNDINGIEQKLGNYETPVDYISSGDGSELYPFVSEDGTSGIKQAISALGNRGGTVKLESARYDVTTPISISHKTINIQGDVWNYPNDPNGVYESTNGVKLHIPEGSNGIQLNGAAGSSIQNIGFNGYVTNGAVKGLFDLANAEKNAGLVSLFGRNDQMHISRVSSCGLASGFSIIPNGDIDASFFEKLNADGCNIGFFFSPKDTYYAHIKDSILADCPAYGLCIKKNETISGNDLQMITVEGIVCVRNGGGFSEEQISSFGSDNLAGMLVSGVVNSKITNNQIDSSGIYWNTSRNSEKLDDGTTIGYLYEYANSYDIIRRSTGAVFETKTYIYDCHGLILSGNTNMVSNNKIVGSVGGFAACIRGNSNMVIGNRLAGTKGLSIIGDSNFANENYVNGVCEVSGNYNTISNSMLAVGTSITIKSGDMNVIRGCITSGGDYPRVIIDSGVTNTKIIGIPASYVTDNGTGTIIS